MEGSVRAESRERAMCIVSNHCSCTGPEHHDSRVCDSSSCLQKTNATIILDHSSQAIHHSVNHHTTVDREVDGFCHVGGDTVQCQNSVPLLQELCVCVVGLELRLRHEGIRLHKGNLCLFVMNHEEEDDALEKQEEEAANPSHPPNTEAGTYPQENSDAINMVNAHMFPEQRRRSESGLSVDWLFEGDICAVREVQPLDHPSALGSDKPQLALVTRSSIKTVTVLRNSCIVAAESSYVCTEYSEQQTNAAELCKEDLQVSSTTTVVFSKDQNLSMCKPIDSLVLSRVLSLVFVSVLVNVLLSEEDEHGDGLVQDCSNPISGLDGQNIRSLPLGTTKNSDVPHCVSKINQEKQENPPRRKDGEILVKLSGGSDEKLHANVLTVKDKEVQADLPSTKDEDIQVNLFSAKDEGMQVNLSSTKDGEVRADLLSTKKEGIQESLSSTQEEEQRNVLITEEEETQEKVQVMEDEDINPLRLTSPDISVNLCEDPVEIMEESRAEPTLEDNRHGHDETHATRQPSTRSEYSQHEDSEVGLRAENDTEHVSLRQTHNTAVKKHTTEALHENPPVDCCDHETQNEFSKDNQGMTALSNEEMNCASLNWALNVDTDTDDDHTAKKMKQDDTNMIHPSQDADCRNTDRRNSGFKNTKSKNTDCKEIESKTTDCKLTISVNKPDEWLDVDFNKRGDLQIPDSRKRAEENPTWDKTQSDLSISEDTVENTIKRFFKELNAKSSNHQTKNKAETLKESKEEDAIFSTVCSTDHISPPFRKWVVSMLRTSQRGSGEFLNEWNRLATFSNLRVPGDIYIIRLANNGFFVPGTQEAETKVECAFCGVRVPLMQFRGRRVEEVHRQVSPSCRVVSGTTVDNVSIQDSVRGVEVPLSLDNRSPPPQGSVPGVFPSSLLPAYGEELQTDDSSEQRHLPPSTAAAAAVQCLPLRDASSLTAAENSRPMTDDGTIVSAQTPDFSNSQIDSATPTRLSNPSLISATASVVSSVSIDSSTTVTNSPSAAALSTPSTSIAISSAATSATASVASSASTDTLSTATTTPISTSGIPNAAETLNRPGEERFEETIPTEPSRRETLQSSSVSGTAAAAVADGGVAAARTDGRAVTASESLEAGTGQVAAAAESARGESGESSDAGEGEGSSSSTANGEQRQTVTYEDLGIFAQRPKRSDMAVTQIRIQTFTNWPHEQTHPAVRMAEAGFYYTGHADLVRCFYCKGGLKTWERSDQPWVEHCRWFPRCPYVRLVKGQRFVDIVQRLNNSSSSSSSSNGSNSGDSSSQQSTIYEAQVTEEVQKMEEEESRNLVRVTAPREGSDLLAASAVDPFEQVLALEGLRSDVDITEDSLEELSERLEDEQDVIRSLTLCKVCQTEEVNVLFLPCGHLVACAQCAPALRTCAICRQIVKGSVRVRMPDDNTDVMTGGHDTRPEGAEPGDTTGTSARA